MLQDTHPSNLLVTLGTPCLLLSWGQDTGLAVEENRPEFAQTSLNVDFSEDLLLPAPCPHQGHSPSGNSSLIFLFFYELLPPTYFKCKQG